MLAIWDTPPNAPGIHSHIQNHGWKQLAHGNSHMIALCHDGQVFTWGNNNHRKLGHEGTEHQVPTKVNIEGTFVFVAGGAEMSAAVTNHGTLYIWGLLESNNYDVPTKIEGALVHEKVTQVACGYRHIVVLTESGSVYTWGMYVYTGHDTYRVEEPQKLRGLNDKHVILVSANEYHSACVTDDGEVFTWGDQDARKSGQLGHRHYDFMTPTQIKYLKSVKVTHVSCGDYHSALCTEEGKVYLFGCASSSVEPMMSPSLVPELDGKFVTKVKCGCYRTIALTDTGEVYSWVDEDGVDDSVSFVPRLVKGLDEYNAVDISSYSNSYGAIIVPNPQPKDMRPGFDKKDDHGITFMVEKQSIYAHRDILIQRSDYFKAMFESNMRESTENVVSIPKCSKDIFLTLLEYIYFHEPFKMSIDDSEDLFQLADMYQLKTLMQTIKRTWDKENHELSDDFLEAFERNGLDLP